MSSETIGDAVRKAARLEMWESVVSSKYVNRVILEEKNTPSYFYNSGMTDHEQKIWLAFRLGILEFRKRYSKKYQSVECIFEGCSSDDTFQHSLECEKNPVKLGGKKDSDMLQYLKELHSLRLSEVGMGLYWL